MLLIEQAVDRGHEARQLERLRHEIVRTRRQAIADVAWVRRDRSA